jgi:hypothetical protein
MNIVPRRMTSSGMLRRVALVRTDVSEETYRLHQQGDKNGRARNNVSTRRDIPENGILHSHRRENLKYYIVPRP